jgi:hypothetical protein
MTTTEASPSLRPPSPTLHQAIHEAIKWLSYQYLSIPSMNAGGDAESDQGGCHDEAMDEAIISPGK